MYTFQILGKGMLPWMMEGMVSHYNYYCFKISYNTFGTIVIRESVDSLCRDDMDAPIA